MVTLRLHEAHDQALSESVLEQRTGSLPSALELLPDKHWAEGVQVAASLEGAAHWIHVVLAQLSSVVSNVLLQLLADSK